MASIKETEIEYRDKRIEVLEIELPKCKQKNKELEQKVNAILGI